MSKRSLAYWEGVTTGLIAGVVVGVVWPRLFGGCGSRPSAYKAMQAINDAPEETKSNPFASRRDGPESAGDPALVAGSGGMAGIDFRTPGAPGQLSTAEQLTMPGRPGQEIDTSSTVRVSSRALSLDGKKVAPRQSRGRGNHPPKASVARPK